MAQPEELEDLSYYSKDKVFLAMSWNERIEYSKALSLKRIADALTQCDKYGQVGFAAISSAIVDGLREGRP